MISSFPLRRCCSPRKPAPTRMSRGAPTARKREDDDDGRLTAMHRGKRRTRREGSLDFLRASLLVLGRDRRSRQRQAEAGRRDVRTRNGTREKKWSDRGSERSFSHSSLVFFRATEREEKLGTRSSPSFVGSRLESGHERDVGMPIDINLLLEGESDDGEGQKEKEAPPNDRDDQPSSAHPSTKPIPKKRPRSPRRRPGGRARVRAQALRRPERRRQGHRARRGVARR